MNLFSLNRTELREFLLGSAILFSFVVVLSLIGLWIGP